MGRWQVAQVREAAERRVAQLHSKIQGLESRLHQLAEENRALSAAARAPGGPSSQVCIHKYTRYTRRPLLAPCIAIGRSMVVAPCTALCWRYASGHALAEVVRGDAEQLNLPRMYRNHYKQCLISGP